MPLVSTSPQPRQVRHLRLVREDESEYDADPPTGARGPFVILPADVLLDTDLSDKALRLYLVLLYHRNRETGQCNPSRKLLAKELGCDVKTVTRMCQELERFGLIERTQPSAGGVNHYVLPLRKSADTPPQECPYPLRTDADTPSAEMSPRTIRREQEEKEQQQGAAAFRPTWPELLGEKYSKVRATFGKLSVEFTDGMFRSLLIDAERDVGPLPESVLMAGLHAAHAALKRQMEAERQGAKPISNLKPYARKILVSKLREVAP